MANVLLTTEEYERRLTDHFDSAEMIAKLHRSLEKRQERDGMTTDKLEPQVDTWATLAWPGDDLQTTLTAEEYMCAESKPTEEEIVSAIEFFCGEQWDSTVRAHRELHGRPCAIINRMPELLRIILANSSRKQVYLQECARRLLIAIIVRRNRDAQRFYNFMASAILERDQITRKKPVTICHPDSIESQDSDHVYIKSPRAIHRLRIVRLLDRVTRWIDPKA